MKFLRLFLSLAVFFTASLLFAGVAHADVRFVANLSALQAVPISTASRTMVCEALLERSQMSPGGWILRVKSIAGDTFPQGSRLDFHRDAPVTQNTPPLFGGSVSGTPGSWFVGVNLADADVELLFRNRWYLTVSTPDEPGQPIRGQIKLANGAYNDYDGDGRTDVQVYRQSANTFFALQSTDGAFLQQPLGQPGDSVSLTVDWDGDGRSDFSTARYNAEVLWRVLPSTTGVLQETRWGSSSLGDFFAAADYDGDGKFDIAVFRAGEWHIIESSTGNFRYDFWGRSGDIPAPNDYDGDGITDLAIARSESGQRVWWIRYSSTGGIGVIPFGLSSDAFFTGRSDFDGDGKADILVIRNQSGQRVFYVLRSSDSQMDVIPWGLSSDVVKLGDYDGDGRTDPAVTRAVNGQRVFYILQSTTGQPRYETFGLQGDF